MLFDRYLIYPITTHHFHLLQQQHMSMPSGSPLRKRHKPRVVTRKSQPRPPIPDYIITAAHNFAAKRALPQAAKLIQTLIRDLKGWLASLVCIEVLPLWVQSASALC